MKISIVIPAFNEERLLGESLKQVQGAREAFAKAGWESELIVCDNNSTDKTAEIAKWGGATVVFEPINQIGRARNCGAAAASGDWILFIDADSHPSAELFGDVIVAIESGKYLAGGSTVRLEAGYRVGAIATAMWNFASRVKKLLAGSFIFCEAAAFRKVGGFDNELFAAEELDLSLKLQKLGKETGRKLVILHKHPLYTSARKMKLYTGWELGGFFLKAMFNQKRMLRSREECHPWYDGRR